MRQKDEGGVATLEGTVVRTPVLLEGGPLVAGRYALGKRIGEGGHGAVYRGHHVALDVPVAIKVMPLPVSLSPREGREPSQATRLERFVREARTVARIQHRNVLHIHDAGLLEDGSPFLVTELIEGADFEQRLRRGPLSVAAAVDLGRQLFSGLSALAEAGVHHRDIKPANLMLRREADGHVHLTLIDFGIAKGRDEVSRLTVTGTIVGTPHYMSPEHLRGEVLDVRADLYAASAVLYEALAGHPPFDGDTTPVVIGRILSAELAPLEEVRPDCPLALAHLIARGLARDREMRPPSPMGFGALLDQLAYEAGIPMGAAAWREDVVFGSLALHGRTEGTRQRSPSAAASTASASIARADVAGRAAADAGTSTVSESLPFEDGEPRTRATWPLRAVLTLGAAALAALFVARTTPEAAHADAPAVQRVSPSAPLSIEAPAAVEEVLPVEDVEPLLVEGLEALTRGETDRALDRYRAAVLLAPERPEAQRGRALSAARAGFDDEAVLAFERYLSLSPDAFDAERIRARVRTLRAHRSAP